MEVYLGLPDEALASICSQMDDITLSNMTKSYGRFYQVCGKILNKRKENLINSLIEKVSGTWLKCNFDGHGMYYNQVEVTYDETINVEELNIDYIKPIMEYMNISSVSNKRYIKIPANDIDRLKELEENLISRRYRKINRNKDIWGTMLYGILFPHIPGMKLDNDIKTVDPKIQEMIFSAYNVPTNLTLQEKIMDLIVKMDEAEKLVWCKN